MSGGLPAGAETHELFLEDWRFRVGVDTNGELTVSFHELSKCAFSCSFADLEACIKFARRHGIGSG